ncbi:MAG: IgGFc-binding protein [Polyangiaceae bacterium]
MRSVPRWVSAAAYLLPWLVACGPGVENPGGSGGSGNNGQGGSTGPGFGGGGSTASGFGGGSGGGISCPTHCSNDLHQVIDCNDQVVITCPSGTGCGPAGDCIEPCASAEANASTIGCDFYSVVPAPEYETQGSCFAVLVANTWDTPINLSAEYGTQSLDAFSLTRVPVGSGQAISYQPLPNGQLNPGQVGIMFLAQYNSGQVYFVPCPPGTQPGITTDPSVDKTGIGNAFHITTSAPIVAYDIYPYGGAASFVSSATLLVPTPAWGTNYIASDAYATNPNLAFVNGFPFVQVVAKEDATNVTIAPTTGIVGGPGVAGTGPGQPATYTLQRGQFIQFLQDAELVGSPIQSDKPISVWGGTACMNVPVDSFACDSGHQELMPVKALGNEYVAVRYRDRDAGANEIVPWMLVGAVDGTTLTYDPATPPGAPTTLESGQMVRFDVGAPFTVKSQDAEHPFYMAGYMTGASYSSNYDGDPEYVNVIPPAQYLPKYLFLTDPTYRNTHLVFTRKRAQDGTFKDVNLDCAGVLTGWQPVDAADQYEYTRFDLKILGTPQGACDDGVHTAESESPFGLTVWGFDETCSYAYPAGMSTRPINNVVVPPVPQ